MRTPENAVKAEIKTWLKEQGAYFFMPVPMGFGVTTIDILVCLRGRFVGIETKAWGQQVTSRQGRVINEIKAAGGLAFVARSLKDVLAELGKVPGFLESENPDRGTASP